MGRVGGGGLGRQVLPTEKRIPGVKIEGLSEVMDVVVSRKEGQQGREWAGLVFGRLWYYSFLGP